MHEENRNIEETKIILEEWKTVINTQIHFNEMIIRARTMVVSVVMAVYGAAALAVGRYPKKFITIFSFEAHVSAVIIMFGIFLLLSIFFIDYFYYYRLLLGAVDHGKKIDEAFQDTTIRGKRLFGLTTAISGRVSEGCATFWLIIFYAIPFILGIIFLAYLVYFYPLK